jgi:nitrite reductase (NADH) large subunit
MRECAEAQSKDFGVIATEKGWNLYIGGNGGAQPRHADLLATDVDAETLIRLIDRFLMYYLQTARPLERTARWLERLDGGLAALRRIVVEDSLGIAAQLEADMAKLVASYACEWAAVVRHPARRRAFLAEGAGARRPAFARTRGQKQPAPWEDETPLPPRRAASEPGSAWVRVGPAADVPADGGLTIAHGELRVAVFHFATRGEWWATQATCPHRKDDVLGRGLLGTQGGTPKVACPLHKRTFSLATGEGLSDPRYCIRTYPVELRDGDVWVKLPPAHATDAATTAGATEAACARA